MSLARLENDRSRFRVVPQARRKSVASEDRVSDVWPDWSTERSPAELAKDVEKNRPATILREAAGAIAYSVGLVILLMAILGVLHVR